MDNAIIAGDGVIAAKGKRKATLAGQVGSEDFIKNAFDRPVITATAEDLGRNEFEMFGMSKHSAADGLGEHIVESMEKNNNSEFFYCDGIRFLWDHDVDGFTPGTRAVARNHRNGSQGSIDCRNKGIFAAGYVVSEGRAKGTAGDFCFHFFPAGDVRRCG